MATLDDAARLASALPDVHEGTRHGNRTWFVGSKGFAWERPFSKADIKRFGAEVPPDGPILAVSVADLEEKEIALATHPDEFFTISHFDGYPAILIQLDVTSTESLEDAILDGWLVVAPAQLADEYLLARGDD